MHCTGQPDKAEPEAGKAGTAPSAAGEDRRAIDLHYGRAIFITVGLGAKSTSPPAHYNLGLVYFEQHQPEMATAE